VYNKTIYIIYIINPLFPILYSILYLIVYFFKQKDNILINYELIIKYIIIKMPIYYNSNVNILFNLLFKYILFIIIFICILL